MGSMTRRRTLMHQATMTRRAFTATAGLAALGTLAACTSDASPPTRSPRTPTTPPPTPTPTATASAPVKPTGSPTTIVSDLEAPWSIVRLPSGSTLISERDSGTILELTSAGDVRTAGTVPGVVHNGEGGLLGLTVPPVSEGEPPSTLYAYFSSDSDNRVVRMPLTGDAGGLSVGAPEAILTGIPKGTFHDGGRIAFGPDRMLYVTAGDATDTSNAQNLESLGGKILRITADGGVPGDNPFAGSPVWSLGHRNPQGIAWDSRGTMWASEFGQDTWDELNIIRPGGNYGWPNVEGIGHNPDYIDPVYQWPTSDASPSGLAIVDDTIFIAGLGGERLWVVYPTNGGPPVKAVDYFTDAYGRLRDVAPGPQHTIWVLTNNTDGRGSPQPDDDKILQFSLAPAS